MKNLRKRLPMASNEAEEMFNNWKDCLPGELINLFYNVLPSEEGQRIGAYELEPAGMKKLQEMSSSSIDRIRIYLGCFNGKFAPFFTIVQKDKTPKYLYYRLDPISTVGSSKAYPIISSDMANLFRRKWEELSDEEVTKAFSGLTCSKIVQKKNSPDEYHGIFRSQRVRYYDFLEKDAANIVEKVKTAPYDQLKVFLGAGLSVQITHPFDFRPIIAVMSQHTDDPVEGGDEEYFERSQPCPPFCHNGIGSGD